MSLNNKNILITGGTGSFGKKFIEKVLKKYKPKRLIIFSRDEQKQFHLQKNFRKELILLCDIFSETLEMLKGLITL